MWPLQADVQGNRIAKTLGPCSGRLFLLGLRFRVRGGPVALDIYCSSTEDAGVNMLVSLAVACCAIVKLPESVHNCQGARACGCDVYD